MVTGWGLPTDWLYLRPLSRLYLDTRIFLTLSIPAVTNVYWVSLLGVKSCKHCGPCMAEGLMSRCSGHSFLITVFLYQGKWVWNLISINVINRSGNSDFHTQGKINYLRNGRLSKRVGQLGMQFQPVGTKTEDKTSHVRRFCAFKNNDNINIIFSGV